MCRKYIAFDIWLTECAGYQNIPTMDDVITNQVHIHVEGMYM